jgi:hypothetical protein
MVLSVVKQLEDTQKRVFQRIYTTTATVAGITEACVSQHIEGAQ